MYFIQSPSVVSGDVPRVGLRWKGEGALGGWGPIHVTSYWVVGSRKGNCIMVFEGGGKLPVVNVAGSSTSTGSMSIASPNGPPGSAFSPLAEINDPAAEPVGELSPLPMGIGFGRVRGLLVMVESATLELVDFVLRNVPVGAQASAMYLAICSCVAVG